jgi:hypothetical protein
VAIFTEFRRNMVTQRRVTMPPGCEKGKEKSALDDFRVRQPFLAGAAARPLAWSWS